MAALVRAQVGGKVLLGLQFDCGRGSDRGSLLRVEFYAESDPIQCVRSIDLVGHQLSLHCDGGSLSDQLEVSSINEWEVFEQNINEPFFVGVTIRIRFDNAFRGISG